MAAQQRAPRRPEGRCLIRAGLCVERWHGLSGRLTTEGHRPKAEQLAQLTNDLNSAGQRRPRQERTFSRRLGLDITMLRDATP